MVNMDKLVARDRVITKESGPNQSKIQEKEDGVKETKTETKEEEAEGSTIMHEEGQGFQESLKGVPWDVIMASNSNEEPSSKKDGMVDNSSVREYHTKG